MRRYKLNRKVQIYLLSIFIVVFIGLIVKNYFSFKIKNVELLENSNVSYKVYLKNSTFFDGNENKQYNFNMIDKIKAKFNYDVSFNKYVSYSSKYFLKANIVTLDSQGKILNNSSTRITDEIEFKDTGFKINFSKNIDIDYEQYYSYGKTIKSNFPTASNVLLKITLYVDSFGEKLELSSLEIPLNDGMIEIKDNNINDRKNSKSAYCSRCFGWICIVFLILDIGSIVLFVRTFSEYKKNEIEVI